jgi:uncharacterized protein (TIGR03437 family)
MGHGPLVATLAITLVTPLAWADVYFNDFNVPPGTTYPEWTSSGYTNSANHIGTVAAGSGPQTVATVASPNGRQSFLGEFGGPAIVTVPPYDPQHFVRVDETVTLTLHDLQPHTMVTVAFDLYILKSWDGNNPNYGPDRWRFSIQGGLTLLDTTFSNNPKTGAYDLSQQNYPIANSANQTGAAAVNTLGYTFYGDSTYHLTFTVAHTGEALALDFSSSMFEGKGTDDESWGLDNVRVSTNADKPIAVSAAAPGAGLAPQGLGSIYGLNLAPRSETAAGPPWPTILAGVTVIVHDSSEADLLAGLLLVAPDRIAFQVPTNIAVGPVIFSVQTPGGSLPSFVADVQASAPALFTANGDGTGVAAATAVRTVAGSLLPAPLPVFHCGEALGSCSSVPIELGADAHVYLTLLCTGIHSSLAGDMAVFIAGESVPVLFVGPDPVEDGLDQVVVELPFDLHGSGEVDVVLQVNGSESNTTRINVL